MSDDTQKVSKASDGGGFYGCQTFFGYFTQVWVWRFRLNIFWKEDPGAAMHDHAWDFVSFPLRSYVEQYLDRETNTVKRQVIRAWRLNRKSAEHAHRYLGKWSGVSTEIEPGAAFTLCYTGAVRRSWMWWRADNGKVRRFPWQPYLRRILNRPRMDHI